MRMPCRNAERLWRAPRGIPRALGGMLCALVCLTASPLPADEAAKSHPSPLADGQHLAKPAEPAELGLRVPKGSRAVRSKGQRVEIRKRSGETAVALLEAEVGEQSLVMLPTGTLTMVPRRDTQPTDKPFVGITPAEMVTVFEGEELGDFKAVADDPFVFVYACHESFFTHTRAILQSLYPGVKNCLKDWGVPTTEPTVPLMVIILRSRAEYDALRRMPPEVLAYYNIVTNYVVLYQDQKFSDVAPELAMKQAAYTIAHEGVHQILANLGVQRRLAQWPMWLSEGLPEYFCPLTVNSKIIQTGGDALPTRTLKWTRAGMVNDLRMYDLLKMSPSAGAVVRGLVHAQDLNSSDYALGWGLVHYLASQRRKEFTEYLRAVSRLGPLESPSPASYEKLFAKHFGNDFAAIEKGVQQHLTSTAMQNEYRDPMVHQTHYVVKEIAKRGKAFQIQVLVTTSPGGARRWREQEKARLANEPGIKAQFYTKVCKTAREAEMEAAKIKRK